MMSPPGADMRPEGPIGEALSELGAMVLETERCGDRRGWARIDPARVTDVARTMIGRDGVRLATITALEVRDGIDVLYHWAIEPRGGKSSGAVLTLKALAARPGIEIDSIAEVVPGANWIEREIHDLLGATFRGHPDMRRLVLDDTWPEGLHPLRKGFDQVTDRPPLPSPPGPVESGEGAP